MRVLATAFDPCTDEPAPNPSQVVIERLTPPPGVHIEKITLPTIYGEADEILRDAINRTQPNLILMTGVSLKADPVKIETTAHNADTSRKPDNAGKLGQPIIIPGTPPTLGTTIPLDLVLPALDEAGVRYGLSGDAGGYLCNHTYYVALHTLTDRPAACLFIHVGPHEAAINECVRACQTIISALAGRNAQRPQLV